MVKKKSLVLDIGGTRIKMAAVQEGEILDSRVIPAFSEGRLEERLPFIKQALDEMTGGGYQDFCGMGIAMPCLVNPDQKRATEIYGKFEDAPSLDISAWVRESFNLPMVMEQDSKAALLGEVNYGVAKGYRDAALVIMGTGVGTAVMMNGKLLTSRNHFAGSLGSHIIIEMNGRKCSCNGSGCLEAYTSSWALPGLIRNHPCYSKSLLAQEEVLDFISLEKHAKQEDVVAMDVLNTVISAMRAGIISLIHAYDPAAIILCGGPLNMGALFTEPLLDNISAQIWGRGNDVQYLISNMPDRSVLLGLHYLVMNQSEGEE